MLINNFIHHMMKEGELFPLFWDVLSNHIIESPQLFFIFLSLLLYFSNYVLEEIIVYSYYQKL